MELPAPCTSSFFTRTRTCCPPPPHHCSAAAMAEASLAAKGTASGLVKDVKFLDMDSAFWQVARQHWLQYGAYDERTIPHLGERVLSAVGGCTGGGWRLGSVAAAVWCSWWMCGRVEGRWALSVAGQCTCTLVVAGSA